MRPTFSPYSEENKPRPSEEATSELAFVELYDRYFKLLFNYTYSKVNDRFAAQEIVQELFVSIWKQWDTNAIAYSRPYLFAAAKKLIISHYRKEYTRQFHYSQWEVQSEKAVASSDQSLLTADLQQRYEKGLQLLSPKCKEVFLFSRQGHSNREIAQELAISEKTVEQHMTKALRFLKTYLREHFVYALLGTLHLLD